MTEKRDSVGSSAAGHPAGGSSSSVDLPPSKLYLAKYRALPRTTRDFIRFTTLPGAVRLQMIDAIWLDYFD